MESLEYKGKMYSRYTNKWVDKNNMVVHLSLQHELNTIYANSLDLSGMSSQELVTEGDKYKEDESYLLAIRFYEQALEICDNKTFKYILPRISSCYRKSNNPQKAIDLFAETKRLFGVEMLTPVLLTTAAAAYCDLNEIDNAKKCANRAYALCNGNCSQELISVFARIKKEQK